MPVGLCWNMSNSKIIGRLHRCRIIVLLLSKKCRRATEYYLIGTQTISIYRKVAALLDWTRKVEYVVTAVPVEEYEPHSNKKLCVGVTSYLSIQTIIRRDIKKTLSELTSSEKASMRSNTIYDQLHLTNFDEKESDWNKPFVPGVLCLSI